MKKYNIITILCYVVSPLGGLGGLVSCRSHDVVVERLVERDTVFQERVLVDSIFVGHEVLMDRSRDTLLIHEKNVEIRYRLLHDSIYIARVDTVTKTLTKTLTKARSPTWFDWISYTALALVIAYILKRIAPL